MEYREKVYSIELILISLHKCQVGFKSRDSGTWPLCRSRVGSDVLFNALRAKSFPLTEQQALIHHACKLVCLCLAAVE